MKNKCILSFQSNICLVKSVLTLLLILGFSFCYSQGVLDNVVKNVNAGPLKFTFEWSHKYMVCTHNGCGKSYVVSLPSRIVSFEEGMLEDFTLSMYRLAYPGLTVAVNRNKRCNNRNFGECLYKNTKTEKTIEAMDLPKQKVQEIHVSMLLMSSNEIAACELTVMPCIIEFLKANPEIVTAFDKKAKEAEEKRLREEEIKRQKREAEQYRIQEERRIAREKEILEKKKAEEEAKRKLDELINSPLTPSESLILGAWDLDGSVKGNEIHEYKVNITFSENKRIFNMSISIEEWSTQVGNIQGVAYKIKDTRSWYQTLSFSGNWGKKDDNTVNLIYENYDIGNGELNDDGAGKLVDIIAETFDQMKIEKFKSKKMDVQFGNVKMKGKKSSS